MIYRQLIRESSTDLLNASIPPPNVVLAWEKRTESIDLDPELLILRTIIRLRGRGGMFLARR